MVDYQLDGMTTLVTGGASGIGAAASRVLAASRCEVAIADRDLAGAQALAEQIVQAGGRAYALAVDVLDELSVDAMVAAVVERSGRLHAAVNSAGIGADWAPVADIPTDRWRTVLGVNLDGLFFSLRAEARVMRQAGGGSIVNIASALAQVARAGSSPYVSSKHGALGLTRAAAIDHALDGIRVNAIAPGFIDTPLLRTRHDAASVALLESLHPAGRLGSAEEVSEAIAWLVSGAASFVTGSIIAVDGGYLAQ